MMKRIGNTRILLPVIALILASGAAWAWQTGTKLMMDDTLLSSDVQMLRGRPYMPLKDVAKALDRAIVKSEGVYILTQAQGVEQREGLLGKMATDLYSGQWRLHVVSVQQADGYSPQFGTDKAPLTPKEGGDILVIITCRLKNGTKAMQEVSFDKNSSGNTALMDTQEHGYVPLAYDSRNSSYSSTKMPPGTIQDFVVLFSVPKGTLLKELLYTVDARGMEKSLDFRISLQP